ncbi:hypothetical protein [Burkholderia cenocepacia]|uniref:hypothetical protein n=1 Tax=Burkholderia cenocepacia TaxID=95486 RepID=UPI002ABDED5A|nr:hypothetical protein [Burkholderia cenocepacia]
MTYTVATLALSASAFQEIAGKLRAAGYSHLFMLDGTIDMTGIGIATEPPRAAPKPYEWRDTGALESGDM